MTGKLIAAALALLASASNCDGKPAEQPTASPVVTIVAEFVAHPANARLIIDLNAVDHAGLPSVNLESGELYPTRYSRRAPYRHEFVFPASAIVTITAEALLAGEPGDLLSCQLYVNGDKMTGIGEVHVAQIESDMHSVQVHCAYHWVGVQN